MQVSGTLKTAVNIRSLLSGVKGSWEIKRFQNFRRCEANLRIQLNFLSVNVSFKLLQIVMHKTHFRGQHHFTDNVYHNKTM